jgi:hypothetical protein
MKSLCVEVASASYAGACVATRSFGSWMYDLFQNTKKRAFNGVNAFDALVRIPHQVHQVKLDINNFVAFIPESSHLCMLHARV